MINYYEEIGIDQNSSLEEIQNHLFKMNKRYHNRLNSSDFTKVQKAEKMIELITQANEIFQTEETRRQYDQQLNMNGSGQKQEGPRQQQRRQITSWEYAQQIRANQGDQAYYDYLWERIRAKDQDFRLWEELYNIEYEFNYENAIRLGNTAYMSMPTPLDFLQRNMRNQLETGYIPDKNLLENCARDLVNRRPDNPWDRLNYILSVFYNGKNVLGNSEVEELERLPLTEEERLIISEKMSNFSFLFLNGQDNDRESIEKGLDRYFTNEELKKTYINILEGAGRFDQSNQIYKDQMNRLNILTEEIPDRENQDFFLGVFSIYFIIGLINGILEFRIPGSIISIFVAFLQAVIFYFIANLFIKKKERWLIIAESNEQGTGTWDNIKGKVRSFGVLVRNKALENIKTNK